MKKIEKIPKLTYNKPAKKITNNNPFNFEAPQIYGELINIYDIEDPYLKQAIILRYNTKPFFQLRIDQSPIAQQRPRLTRGHVYNPQAEIKEAHGWIFKQAMMRQHKNSSDKPLIVQLVFAFKDTSVKSPTKTTQHCTKKIDLDNLQKFIFDAMQPDIVYHDDSQIIQVTASKIYAPKPYTEITIWEL